MHPGIEAVAVTFWLGALLAPYVAQATLTIADRVTVYYPAGCLCAALIAWRIARRQFN